MKFYVFTLLILFCGLQATNAQAYKPIPTSDAMWREVKFELSLQGFCEDYQYLIIGDTIIAGMIYHKLQRTGYVGTHNAGNITHIDFINEYAGCFRNDTLGKKVWLVFPENDVEKLVFDFDLKKGDSITVNDGYVGIVKNIDTLSLNDMSNKRFYILCPEVPNQLPSRSFEIIEGIGSSIGLFPRVDLVASTWLRCFSINGEIVYWVQGDCTPVNVEDCFLDKSTINLFPNPTYSTFKIKGIENYQNVSVSILNLDGQIVMEEQRLHEDNIIDVKYLFKGVYIVNIRLSDNIVTTCKLIKL